MEPAGRYAWQNFVAFVKPKLKDCKKTILSLGKHLVGLFGAICLGLAFGIAALKKGRKNEREHY